MADPRDTTAQTTGFLKPPAGFVRVQGPVKGGYIDFPEGTDEAKINEVMAQAYKEDQGANAVIASEAKPALLAPGAHPSGDPTKPNILIGTLDDPRIKPEQKAAYLDYIQNDASYDPKAPPGSANFPILNLEGAPVPVGANYFDIHGNLQRNEGKPDQLLGAYNAVTTPLNNAAIWAKEGLGKVIGPEAADTIDRAGNAMIGLPSSEEVRDIREQGTHEAAVQGRRPGTLGGLGGGVIGTAPIMAVTRNPWIAGALAGASETKDPYDPTGTAIDAGTGAIGGKVADVGVRSLGSFIAPRIDPMVRRLLDQNVELTPGQIVGGLPHRTEDAARSLYGIGDLVIARQADAQRSFVRSAIQQSLDPIGVQIPRGTPAGHAQIDFAQRTLDDAYSAVIPNLGTRLDQPFLADIAQARRTAMGLPRDKARVFNRFMRDIVLDRINRGNTPGHVDGQTFKDLESLLGQRARSLRTSPDPFDRDLAGAFDDVQHALRDMVGRQNPQAAQAVAAINDGYANLVRVELAAGQAKGQGVFTPSQLREVAASHTGRRARARGAGRMQQFADDANTRMSSTMGDSGTASRVVLSGLAAGALYGTGAVSKSLSVNPWAAGGLAALAAPYAGRRAGAIARTILTRRPAGSEEVRGMVDAIARRGIPAQVGGSYPALERRKEDADQ